MGNKIVRKQTFVLCICFLFSPLIALGGIFVEIFNKQRYAVFLLSLFLSICAYIYIPSGDLYRYWVQYKTYETASIHEIISNYQFDYIVYILLWISAKLELGHAFIRFILMFICFNVYTSIILKILSTIDGKKEFFRLFMLSILLFPFWGILTGLRFGTASVFVFVSAYFYFVVNSKLKGIFFIALASLTHFSCIVLIPLMIISRCFHEISRSFLIISVSFILLFNVFILPDISIFSDIIFYSKIEAYTSGNDYVDTTSPLLQLFIKLPRILLLPIIIYVVFIQKVSCFRNYIFLIILLVCFVMPYETPFGRYLSLLSYLSFLGYLLDYVHRRISSWRILLACYSLLFILQAMPLYKSLLLSNYPSLLYTPYPLCLTQTYDDLWIWNHIHDTGEIFN